MKTLLTTAAIAAIATTTSAQTPPHCPSTSPDLCYRLSIPPSTASSGTGPIYLRLSGPTTYSWMALGQGDQMDGAQIFVVYTDAQGNVTVSPRLGRGHVMPMYVEGEGANVTLLEGSGVQGGRMVATFRCNSGCESWSGGNMDFTSSNGRFIFARSSGSPLGSMDPNEPIQIHDDHGSFDWDFASARSTTASNSANPFLASSQSSSSSGSAGGGVATPVSSASDSTSPSSLIIAHAVLASLAFILFFTTGGIILRLASFSGLVWVHAAIQIAGYVLFTAAVGLGIHYALQGPGLNHAHPIIGLVLFGVLFFQPFSGLQHHRLFKRHGIRTLASWTHIGIGRAAVILGIVNGGLGLQWAAPTPVRYYIVYGVFGGLFGVAFLAAGIFGESRRRRNTQNRGENGGDSKEKNGNGAANGGVVEG